MAIALTNDILQEMSLQAQQQGERIWQPLEFGAQQYVPKRLGEIHTRTLYLRNGLRIYLRQGQLKQDIHHTFYGDRCSLVAMFYLLGSSRLQAPGAGAVAADYEEAQGYHYLFHLPDHTKVEEWFADEPIQVVRLEVDPSYFRSFEDHQTAFAPALQKLIAGDSSQWFHQSLGPITLTIKHLLQQILHCPYSGLMQQIYLESKALELFAAQFAIWTETPTRPTGTSLSAHDIEQLHQAREILIQRVAHPPSLIELARQVGLNDHKLKQGFRELFGTTTFDYLRDYRLQQAKELLHNPNLKVAHVAAMVGYKSPEAFCNAFRRKFDISPKAYQLRLRG